ncbi:orotidine-5'-phosphate decarboxylase [Nonomuraea sp. NPDC050790]|uniref:orotidine-5'-phosphate decarboxylase n=1 Tax=Nonomuraea sp. NPDC050790 TaxID=3364371 RepID=UPI003787A39A
MEETFGARLRSRLDKYGPLCVGLDPSPAQLLAWGLDDSPAGLERFSRTVVEEISDVAAVVKPQSAFYERWGSRGLAVLERTVRDLRAAGPLVILDAKRGDVESTMIAYAEAYLDPGSPLASDALTVSPYLGLASLAPAIRQAHTNDAGLFILARTSNPQAEQLQSRVADQVFGAVASLNQGASPLGSIGVVVGATVADPAFDLSTLNGPILAPGLGAQGASPSDLARLFADVRHAVIPSVSRAVTENPARIREVTLRYRDDCAHHLTG